jgi:hypothetical protein
MNEEQQYEKLMNLIDEQARTTVGILMKRIDNLLEAEERDKINLSPDTYKELIKDNVYEQFRHLRKIIEVFIKIGRVEFKSRGK